jgi:hypothetical protein
MTTTTATLTPAVAEAITAFLAIANEPENSPVIGGDEKRYCHFIADKPGRKVTRIIMVIDNGGSRSVHCFIDNATGDVYKAAGWKAPAKGARGNIVTGLDDIADRFDWSGGYLYR